MTSSPEFTIHVLEYLKFTNTVPKSNSIRNIRGNYLDVRFYILLNIVHAYVLFVRGIE